MCCKKIMCTKVLPVIFVIIALALAVTVTFWRQDGLALAVSISRFFDVMIPVLAVGALLKYILGCHPCREHHEHHEDICCQTTKEEERK